MEFHYFICISIFSEEEFFQVGVSRHEATGFSFMGVGIGGHGFYTGGSTCYDTGRGVRSYGGGVREASHDLVFFLRRGKGLFRVPISG